MQAKKDLSQEPLKQLDGKFANSYFKVCTRKCCEEQ